MTRTSRAGKSILTGLRWLMLLAAAGAAGQTPGRTFVEFQPVNPVTVAPGKATPLEITFHVKDGYHINSSKPLTPELIPTVLGLTPPAGIVIAKVQYPSGQLTTFPFDPSEKLSVYSGNVIIKAAMIAQPNAAEGNYTVHGELKYQACDNNSCYPPKKLPVQFDVQVSKHQKK